LGRQFENEPLRKKSQKTLDGKKEEGKKDDSKIDDPGEEVQNV